MKKLHAHAAKAVLIGAATLTASSAIAQTELDFWSWRQEDVKAYNEIIAAFEQANPDIKVNFSAHPATEYNTIIATALAAGEGPDIIQTRSYGGLEALAKPGYLEPLDDKIDLSAISEGALLGTTMRSDGKVYAVPFATQTVMVYYNKDIFEAQGLELPETWDEFKAVMTQLKEAGIMPLANGTADAWYIEILAGGIMPNFYGGDFFADVTSEKTDFEDPRYVGALEKLLELKDYLPDGYQGIDWATEKQLFNSGAAAMFVGGSFEMASMIEAGVNFGVMAAPAAEAGGDRFVATWLDGGYGVNAASENKEAALKFAQFTATAEFGQMFTDKLGNISPIAGVEPSDPAIAAIAELNKSSSPYIFLVGYRFNTPTGSTLFQNNSQEMFAGAKTPEEVAKAVSDGIKASE